MESWKVGKWENLRTLAGICEFHLFLEDVFKRNLTEFLGRRHIVIDCLKCLFPRPPKRAIANLDPFRAAKTNPANFVLHEITDSCARFGIRSNGSGYPFEKKNCNPLEWLRAIRSRKIAILSKGSGYPLEKIVIRRSNGSGYPLEKIFIRSNG